MKIDPLQDLLSRADSAAPPPVIGAGLANRVVRTARRRQVRRNVLLFLSAMVACGLAVSVSRRSHPVATHGEMNPTRLAEIRTELARLDADAQSHQRVVADLQRRQSLTPRRRISLDAPTEPDALDRVDQARNRTALILLRQADRAADDPASQKEAGDLYSRAARLFPTTPAGRIAAQRLKRPAIPT